MLLPQRIKVTKRGHVTLEPRSWVWHKGTRNPGGHQGATLSGDKARAVRFDLGPWRKCSHLDRYGAMEGRASWRERRGQGGNSSICPSISTQYFPLAEPKKETGGNGAWEMMFASISPKQNSRAGEGQWNCHQG